MKNYIETKNDFSQFGIDVENSSKIYSYLAKKVSEDPKLLQMVSNNNKNNQLSPLILFGSVQYLLLKGIDHPLKTFFPTLTGKENQDQTDFYPIFQNFCYRHLEELSNIIRSKIVQTNEVGRSAILTLGFDWILQRESHASLSLIEIGTSAGLNLFWDKYSYKFNSTLVNPGSSDLLLLCSSREEIKHHIDFSNVQIIDRIGIDLNPLNVHNPEDVLWLQALIWPEQKERLYTLQKAINIVNNYSPLLIKGNAVEMLQQIFEKVNKGSIIVIFQSFTFYLMSGDDRNEIIRIIEKYSENHVIYFLSIEWQGLEGKRTFLKATYFKNAHQEKYILAQCHHHGEWVKWLNN